MSYSSKVVIGLQVSLETKFYELEITEVERYATIMEFHTNNSESTYTAQQVVDHLVATLYPLTLIDEIIRLYSKVEAAEVISY